MRTRFWWGCSSGFSAPRPSAWHMEHDKKNFWGVDNLEQFSEILAAQNDAVDIWSIHHYETEDCWISKSSACVNNASLAIIAASVAKKYDALLYVGEYGGPHPNFTGPSTIDQAFPASILKAQVENVASGGSFQISTIWSWACPSHRDDMVCIFLNSSRSREQGSSRMVKLIQEANSGMVHGHGKIS
eukprot:UC4_evm1s1394